MSRLYKAILIYFSLLYATAYECRPQPPAFYHLSTAEGLSDNKVNAAARDRQGILWIGTTEGLNCFDGNRITRFYRQQYPLLADNDILGIVVDDRNRVWLRTSSPDLNMFDENRNLHRFSLGDSSMKMDVSTLFNTRSMGMIAVKDKKQFVFDEKKRVFLEKNIIPAGLIPSTLRFYRRIDGDKMLYYGQNRLFVWDFAAGKTLLNLPIQGLSLAAWINKDELLAGTLHGGRFYRISLSQQSVIGTYSGLKDQHGEPIEGNLRFMERMGENRFVITTRFSGLYFLDLSDTSLQHWEHDPLDPRSIGGNNTYFINYDTSGYLFITTQTSGLHYYNTRHRSAYSQPYFIDSKKDVFDGFIMSVTREPSGMLWMGAQDRLIRWDGKGAQADFISLRLPNGRELAGFETIRSVMYDRDRLWVGTTRYGILVVDRNSKTLAHYYDSSFTLGTLPSPWINAIYRDSSGSTWVGTLRGAARIDDKDGKATTFKNDPLLKPLHGSSTFCFFTDSRGRLWIGNITGAWCYDRSRRSLVHYGRMEGLPSSSVYAIQEDAKGRFYFGTARGLSVLSPDGQIRNYDRTNGLRNDRCEGILRDRDGFIWVGNLNCLLRFDPDRETFAVKEEGYGFSHAGFRMRCSYLDASGIMFWGTDKGITWFDPIEIGTPTLRPSPAIYALDAGDSLYRFTGFRRLRFPYNAPSFTFYFTSGELGSGKKSQMRYRLSGIDQDWKTPGVNGQAVYTHLPSGHFNLQVEASRDGVNWIASPYSIEIMISKPWWLQTWFLCLAAAFLLLLAFLAIRYWRRRQFEQAVERAIAYFSGSRYDQSDLNGILWDICRNCIAMLGIKDCVIYLINEERNVLEQKAAFGAKSHGGSQVLNPIEIPVGTGIVGTVALTGIAERIADTSRDKRYLLDDEPRLSELAVPLVHDGHIIGVIDSEHPRRNFFGRRHLSAFQSIATICSAKIARARALEAIRENEQQLLELKLKMAESRFLNLRLQMNPHFLFNSLSSIQHLIISQQTNKAYKYLTIFSNFLRTLLQNAEQNFIPLDEERRILELYIELESLRFDESFHWEVVLDESMANDVIWVPTLVVQPFVENAIWHGLLHQEGEKWLRVSFRNNRDESLTCCIEDNGIGRERAAAIRQQNLSAKVHESKGIFIIRERLKLLEARTGKPATLQIGDRQPCGTVVTITIPFYNPDEL